MKSRLKKIEQNIRNAKKIELPLFLPLVNGYILVYEYILKGLNVDYSIYEYYKDADPEKEPIIDRNEGYLIPLDSPIIHAVEGESWAKDCYVYFKGYENSRIILL
jgi:hypothetical protein